ncbi:MAG: protein-export chaperone SecB [Thioalkalivibrionaceae bacterium]
MSTTPSNDSSPTGINGAGSNGAPNGASAQNASDTRPEFSMQKIYLKDVSFESPRTPEVFLSRWDGKTNVQMNTTATRLEQQDDLYEVELQLTVTTDNEDKTAYLCEIRQAGVFLIRGFEAAQREALLGAYCPNVLFAFAREAVADLVQKGGFPQLLLQPVNFDALYQQHLAQRQAGQGSQAPVPPVA